MMQCMKRYKPKRHVLQQRIVFLIGFSVVCVFEQTLQDNQRLTYAKDLMLCTDSIDAAQTQNFVGGTNFELPSALGESN